jgi:hypothetical protein
MENILHLPLKSEWYNLIESGIKTEEYREIKPYWIKRLCITDSDFKHYDKVKFSYGYTKKTMTFLIEKISKGKGKKEWGAMDDEVFIITLGNRVE